VHNASSPHPLQDIPDRFLWVEIDADVLRAEAFWMLSKERENPLPHGTTTSPTWLSVSFLYYCIIIVMR
jgi:hypothetical protein